MLSAFLKFRKKGRIFTWADWIWIMYLKLYYNILKTSVKIKNPRGLWRQPLTLDHSVGKLLIIVLLWNFCEKCEVILTECDGYLEFFATFMDIILNRICLLRFRLYFKLLIHVIRDSILNYVVTIFET